MDDRPSVLGSRSEITSVVVSIFLAIPTYGFKSTCWSFSREGYVGFEYVRCSAMRPGRCNLSTLDGSSALTTGVSTWGSAVLVAGSGSDKVPVTMSASQSPKPPGAASTAV